MFSWFSNLFSSPPKHGSFSPRERLIYRYFDGSKVVAADPLVLYKRIMAVGPEMSVDMKVSASPSKDAGKAHDGLVAKVRQVFGLVPLDQGGLTEIEATDLLDHFLTFCEDVKKNSRGIPTSAAAMPAATGSSSGGGSVTSNGAASGSIEKGPSTDGPEKSPTEPGSPSGS